MMYRLMHWVTGIALHWFYSSVRVEGRDRIPGDAPVLLAASHHNALVDCLIAVWLVPRRVTITAKATLVDNPVNAWLFRMLGIVPLRRAGDEKKKSPTAGLDAARNAGAFGSLLDVLGKNGMVLIFPEGKSHSEPALAPLRTGIARIALEARDVRKVRGLQIVPLGLNFEEKGNPGTAVLAEVGEPILMDSMGAVDVETLTAEVARRLKAVSLKSPVASSEEGEIAGRSSGARPFVTIAAAWGELTHRHIINFAREQAQKRGRNADDPAMLTMIFGLQLILISYVVQFAVLAAMFNVWVAALYVATLPVGAYWAAFKNHHRPSE
ncbi:MAG: 1-acyl-sn-glycerol-3-phosphate acyltransferase [Gemmatimonadaceae bacterium]